MLWCVALVAMGLMLRLHVMEGTFWVLRFAQSDMRMHLVLDPEP